MIGLGFRNRGWLGANDVKSVDKSRWKGTQTTPRNNPDYLWETSMEKTDDVEMLAVEILNLGSKTRMLVHGTHWRKL